MISGWIVHSLTRGSETDMKESDGERSFLFEYKRILQTLYYCEPPQFKQSYMRFVEIADGFAGTSTAGGLHWVKEPMYEYVERLERLWQVHVPDVRTVSDESVMGVYELFSATVAKGDFLQTYMQCGGQESASADAVAAVGHDIVVKFIRMRIKQLITNIQRNTDVKDESLRRRLKYVNALAEDKRVEDEAHASS